MEKFDALLKIADQLLGPNGCPWDHSQTFQSLQPYVLEEAHEVVEAVDEGSTHKIVEELGDLLYTVVFYAKLGEKEGCFTIQDILQAITDKLIRRHPHVFADLKVEDVNAIIENWEAIKTQEKQNQPSKTLLEGIPPSLSGLMRAQKYIRKLVRGGYWKLKEHPLLDEASLGQAFLDLVVAAEFQGLDAEGALRRTLHALDRSTSSHVS